MYFILVRFCLSCGRTTRRYSRDRQSPRPWLPSLSWRLCSRWSTVRRLSWLSPSSRTRWLATEITPALWLTWERTQLTTSCWDTTPYWRTTQTRALMLLFLWRLKSSKKYLLKKLVKRKMRLVCLSNKIFRTLRTIFNWNWSKKIPPLIPKEINSILSSLNSLTPNDTLQASVSSTTNQMKLREDMLVPAKFSWKVLISITTFTPFLCNVWYETGTSFYVSEITGCRSDITAEVGVWAQLKEGSSGRWFIWFKHPENCMILPTSK